MSFLFKKLLPKNAVAMLGRQVRKEAQKARSESRSSGMSVRIEIRENTL
jgi:hypothetical protein